MDVNPPKEFPFDCRISGHAGCTRADVNGEEWVTHHPALSHPCTCREDVVCGACMSGAADPVTPTPPADDVREALFKAIWGKATDRDDLDFNEVADRIFAAFEVRPRGTVTDAEVDAAGRALYGISWGDEDLCDPILVRAALEAAREVRS